jgi:hypothetical protein
MVTYPLLSWTTSSVADADSSHVHSSSSLVVFDQVQGAGYSESEVEIDVAALELETDVAALKLETDAAALELETDTSTLVLETNAAALHLETEIDVSQEISKQERCSAD